MKCLLLLLFTLFAQIASALQLVFPSPLDDASCEYSTSSDLVSKSVAHCNAKDERGLVWLSPQWTVLGPFPAGMREHQLGAFPALAMHPLPSLFNLSTPIDVPSTYGRGGCVRAKKVESIVKSGSRDKSSTRAWHSVLITYPEVDWKAIQQSAGWAGIQWQALAITDLHVEGNSQAIVSMTLDSAAESAVLSEEEYVNYDWKNCSAHVKWYNGDWYSYTKENLADGSELPGHTLILEPGRYKVLIKSVYEVRIFGGIKNDKAPVIEYGLDVRIRNAAEQDDELRAITTGQFSVVPDIVDGNFAGWGISFGLRNYYQQSIEIQQVQLVGKAAKYFNSIDVYTALRWAPSQLRPVKLKLVNLKPIPADITYMKVKVVYKVASKIRYLIVDFSLRHIELFSSERREKEPRPYLYTFLDSDETVQYAIATPPRNVLATKAEDLRPAILHHHGAGVDIRMDEAQHNFLAQNHSWIIEPSGRSPWGYDWQMASHLSARTALKQFSLHMYGIPTDLREKAAKIDTSKIMITGHSNGGQGANHFANHRPDEVIGAVIAAGYISLAEYVPLTWQLGRHYNDAALNGILRSSLNAFENDLFASNLAGLPILIKYGSEDNNVPAWHSREHAALIKSWNRHGEAASELVKISERPAKPHWWPEIMQEYDVQSAIDAQLDVSLNPDYQMPTRLNHFTLSVFNPEDSGSKQGWKITQVEVPGRMARLEVEYREGGQEIKIRSAHVLQMQVDFDIERRGVLPQYISIDGKYIDISQVADLKKMTFEKTRQGWARVDADAKKTRSVGPMIRFLSSPGPIYAVVPTNCAKEVTQHYLSVAIRFSTDAYLYGRLDTVILYDLEANSLEWSPLLGSSNVLLLGGPTINTISRIASKSQTLIRFLDGSSQFSIRDRIYSEGSTLLTLFPHPYALKGSQGQDKIDGPRPMTLLLHGTDPLAIERGYSLLPVRTGTLLPEWIVVDRSSLWKGYGGVVGAGWFDHNWSWSEAMSYIS